MPRASNLHSPAERQAQARLDEEALRLRCEEMLTTTQIVERLGVSQATAVRRCQRAEKRVLARLTDDVRSVKVRQDRRYERVLARAWEDYEGDRTPKRLEMVLKTLDRISALWGLDRANEIPSAVNNTQVNLVDRATLARLLGLDPITGEPVPFTSCVEADVGPAPEVSSEPLIP
jgi:predicted DNA-binding protein (UPF0251 family)